MHNRLIILIFSFLLFLPRTSPSIYAKDDDRFRFIIMGCAHFGVLGSGDYALLTENLKRYDPDFILFLSDTADYPQEKPMEPLRQEFLLAIDKLKIPVYDLLDRCRLMNHASGPGGRGLLKKNRRLFEYKNNLFIYPDPEGSDQTDFLKNSTGDISRSRNLFMFTHQSPWFEGEKEWATIIPFLTENKVKYIFGPNLQYLLPERDRSAYKISRFMPCYLRRRPDPSFLHFLVVDVNKEKVSIEFVPVKNLDSEETRSGIPSVRETLIDSFGFARPLRVVYLNPPRIIETMKIRPGMDILDIGAGTGLFTFYFAEALKGKGRLFATDVDPNAVEHIKKEAERSGYSNIYPVLVKGEGLDPFYKKDSFDIIFMCEVYLCLQHPEDYFRELRPSLKKDGRLYIISLPESSFLYFNEIEFGDFKGVIRVLASEGRSFPVFQRLKKELRDFIEGWKGEDIPPDIRIKFVQELNGMRPDKRLLGDLMDYYAREEINVNSDGRAEPQQFSAFPYSLGGDNKWLIVSLDAGGVFREREKNLNDVDRRQLSILNRILLTEILGSSGPAKVKEADPVYEDKKKVVSALEAAGYQLVREHGFLTHYYFLEFKNDL